MFRHAVKLTIPYAEAETLLQREIAAREQLSDSTHSDSTYAILYLASLYQKQGKYAEAEPLLLRVLAIRELMESALFTYD